MLIVEPVRTIIRSVTLFAHHC